MTVILPLLLSVGLGGLGAFLAVAVGKEISEAVARFLSLSLACSASFTKGSECDVCSPGHL